MGILGTIAIVLIIFWIGGLLLHIAGGLINLLLIVAVVLLAIHFFRPKTS